MLPFVRTGKFLSLPLDRSLTWMYHMHSLRARFSSLLSISCTLCGSSWSANRSLLLQLYCALISSVLDYGSIVYVSASPSTLQVLSMIHHAGIRFSIVFSVQLHRLLAHRHYEPSLCSHQDIFGNYAAKISGLPNHSTTNISCTLYLNWLMKTDLIQVQRVFTCMPSYSVSLCVSQPLFCIPVLQVHDGNIFVQYFISAV